MKYLLIFLLSLALTVGLFAQDTTRTNAQNKPQYKKGYKTQVQKRQQTNRDIGNEDNHGNVVNSEDEQNQIRWQKGDLTKSQSGYMMSDDDGDGIPNGQDPDFTGAKIRSGNANGGFVDLDGDGINDKAMDDDGDGIPNGKDPDYTRPEDGSGNMYRHQHKIMTQNGSGGYGPGNGTGNSGVGPNNGSGFGPGNCDDVTPPKGSTSNGNGKK